MKETNNSNGCNDIKCPYHGHLKLRGRTFIGIILSAKMHRTVVVEWEWKNYLPKYERYENRRTRIKAHNPDCIRGIEGEIVKIKECRPLSKTKHFVVIEKIGKEKGFAEKKEAREEAKVIIVKKAETSEIEKEVQKE